MKDKIKETKRGTKIGAWFVTSEAEFVVLVKSHVKPKKKEVVVQSIDESHCPVCGCLYDDKMKGAQGRDGSCECYCKHISRGGRFEI
jgi:hypothetical protein